MKKITKQLISFIFALSVFMLPTTNADASFLKEDKTTIVDIASKDTRFSTLVKALESAELLDILNQKGPYTVFAPTNDAFDKLPAGTLDTLLKPENKEALKGILLYHVSNDKLSSKDLSELNCKEITTANNQKLKIKIENGNIYINDSKIIITDIEASNGIIHAIDAVLIPN